MDVDDFFYQIEEECARYLMIGIPVEVTLEQFDLNDEDKKFFLEAFEELTIDF